jgi:hypothetical protein
MTRSRTPAFRRRLASWTMRQRLTLLLTCSMRPRAMPSSRLASRHDDLDVVQRKCQKAQILEQPAARGQGVWGGIGNAFIMGTARIGLTQKEDREHRIDPQDVFDCVILFLAAITARLLSRILGAFDAPFGPIVAKRGEAGAGAAPGGSDVVGDRTPAATLASATPMRWASSVTDLVGVSPSARSVACSTTNRTCIHCWALLWPIPNSGPCTTCRG